ncbi:MAG: hypothetical protein ACR2QK_12905 [Acidimicrobiales bacterium]
MQVVDMQPGINPNGLFWTAQVPRVAFRIDRKSRSAILKVTRFPLVETYQAFGPLANPGLVNVTVRWTAIGDPTPRGKGGDVAPDDPAAFLGEFRDAHVTARVEGYRPGLNFRTDELSSDGFYANMGTMRNGSDL